jgi:hopene-associated glycosyltransferase HpnB
LGDDSGLYTVSAELLAAAALAIWAYLLLGRGFFWLARERDDTLVPKSLAAPKAWPSVTVIVPARDEADVIAEAIGSLVAQNYPGRFGVVLVDDQSSDGTADVARRAARAASPTDRLTVLTGSEPPAGWTGKLWALERGFRYVEQAAEPPDYVLFTDADIAYRAPAAIRRLVEGALARGTVLTSLMVRLRCESFAERLLVPAFVFFFDMLYPFAWVNDARKKTAAAAGGCMLVRRQTLVNAGGIQKIRGALIDDCALAALLKRHGPIRLGLTKRVESLRPYPKIADIRRMVARSAYAELRYSPLRLAGALVGMALTYLAPPLFAIFGEGLAQIFGLVAWLAMAIAFVPMLILYRRWPLWGIALPVIAAFYTAFTLDSAIQHWRGRGGAWKGRFQAPAASARGVGG